ncbi:MAG: hypothetical protein NVS3B3_17430 [Aquirhabdus sp.]
MGHNKLWQNKWQIRLINDAIKIKLSATPAYDNAHDQQSHFESNNIHDHNLHDDVKSAQ